MVNEKKRKRNGRWKVILAVVAVVAVVVAVVAVAGFSWEEKYDDSYFVSDDTKLVIPLDRHISLYEDGEYEPEVTYEVYYYSGDDVTGSKVFFAYSDKESAVEADENISMDDKEWATSKKLVGRFIVFDVAEDQYSGVTAEYIRDLIDKMREAGTIYEPEAESQNEEVEDDDIVDDDSVAE